MQKASYGGGGKFKLTTAFFSCTPSYPFLLLFSFPSYVFLYGHDASGGRDDDDHDHEDDQEGESGEDSSSDNDSLLSDLDGREGMSDDDDGDGGDGAGATPTGKKKPAAGVDSSKRKTMFAEMKRESMAGSLQPSAKKGGVRRQRRDSTGDSDEEDLEQMQVPIEEEEEEEEDSGDDDQEGARGARSKSKSRSAKNKNNAGSSRRRGRAKANTSDDGHGSSDDEEDVSDLSSSVASDDNDQDDDEDEGGGNSSGDEEEEEGDGEAQPRFLIYFWAGTRAKKSDWVLWKLELAKSMLPEWQKVINAEIPQVQVAQGQEPLHFRRLFGQGRDHGRLIVHDRVWRKRDNPEKRVSLFKVQRVPEGEFQTFQARDRYTTRWRREGERGREFSQVGGREVQCVIGACCGRFAAVCRWLVRDGCRAWLDLTR